MNIFQMTGLSGAGKTTTIAKNVRAKFIEKDYTINLYDKVRQELTKKHQAKTIFVECDISNFTTKKYFILNN